MWRALQSLQGPEVVVVTADGEVNESGVVVSPTPINVVPAIFLSRSVLARIGNSKFQHPVLHSMLLDRECVPEGVFDGPYTDELHPCGCETLD